MVSVVLVGPNNRNRSDPHPVAGQYGVGTETLVGDTMPNEVNNQTAAIQVALIVIGLVFGVPIIVAMAVAFMKFAMVLAGVAVLCWFYFRRP
jgi:hypothetical protein